MCALPLVSALGQCQSQPQKKAPVPSIGGLSRACGSGGYRSEYRYRNNGKRIPLDFVANAGSLGAYAVRATADELKSAIRGFRN